MNARLNAVPIGNGLREREREVLIDMLRRLHENLGAVTGQS